MNVKIFFLFPAISFLSACQSMMNSGQDTKEWVYPIVTPYDENSYLNHGGETEAKPLPKFVKTSEVPQAQVSAKNVDVSWVEQQNPSNTTILLTSDNKPLPVSMALMQAPKDERSAALKYEKNGQIYYSGVYGNYNDQASAEQALQKLPENLRKNARIVNWTAVQHLNYI
jgi:septal ring-binding cell division protein DamX